ncbi:MAG: Hsp20/alpha crystallin family protein [Erysipelotrichaceae bacterium]|nr:Hsp20/alpha crystallin family protein [Solobacterium sp.]MDO5122762.1 Hsp20/alpha crystallin family protein [Erysipelotrichaceae bacterium]
MMRFAPARNDLFDSFFDDMFPTFNTASVMRTDIREKDGNYLLDIDLPGYKKEDIKISLYNGNLTIQAEHNDSKEEKDAKGNVIRQERYSGTCSRTFYVGESIRESDIHAGYENGILTLQIPTEQKKEAEEKKYINIL